MEIIKGKLYVLAIILLFFGCASLPPLPKIEYNESSLKLHPDYDIEQTENISGNEFKLTSPNEKILLNIYDINGTLIGTLYNGTGGIFLIDLDSISSKYDFKLSSGEYFIELYGKKGKAEFNLKVVTSNYKPNYNVNMNKDEIDYYTKLAEKSVFRDSLTGEIHTMPYPIGDIEGIQNKIIYPNEAIEKNIQGKVVVNCLIDSLGNVTKVELVKGLGQGLNESVMRAVKLTKFIPGKIDGKPVETQLMIPIVFGIRN